MCQACLTPKWSRSATAATHTAFPFTGAEVREDVFLIWREMEEACSTLAQVQMLVSKFPKSNVSLKDCGGSCVCLWALMPSHQWYCFHVSYQEVYYRSAVSSS